MNNKTMKRMIPVIIVVVIAIVISLVFVLNHEDPKEYDNKLEQAQKYVEEMDYKRAETAYLEAIDIDSKQTKAYVELANVYIADGKEEKALKILDKGIKNVDKEKQQEIKKKKEKIKKKTKSQGVINNGGNRVTYKGKTYYWKYNNNSLYSLSSGDVYKRKECLWYKEDTENILVSQDNQGKEETVYKGIGNDKLWIYGERIYAYRTYDQWFSIKLDGTDEKTYDIANIHAVNKDGLIVSKSSSLYLLEKESDELKLIKENANFCYFEDNKVYYDVLSDGEYYNENLDFGSIDVNGENDLSLIKLNAKDYYGEDYEYQMRIPIAISCTQIIDDDIYFQYGGYDGSSYIYQGGEIAKVKKDGTGFMNIKTSDDYEYFTAYKNGNDVEIKEGGALNKPFLDYDYNSSKTSISIYTNENSNKKELVSSNEYDTGDDIEVLDYYDDMLYFVSYEFKDDLTDKYTFYKKDLKTNKIEKLYEVNTTNDY